MVDIPFRHGTLDTPLRRAAMVQPDKVALIDGEHRFTYRQLAERVARLRGGLRSLGLSDGDRVAGLSLNSSRHFEAWFAIPTANLIFNDLNFRLALPELQFIVDDSGASVLCADARHWATATAFARSVRLDPSAGVDGRRTVARWLADLGRTRGARADPRAAHPRRRLRRQHHLHRRHHRPAQGRDADARQPDGQRQAHAVGEPAVRIGSVPAPDPDVPLGRGGQHLRAHARRRHARHVPRLRRRSGRPHDRGAPHHGRRAGADHDQHVPQPPRHR